MKARTQVTKRAKKPKTEITMMAQWGNDVDELSPLLCTLPVGLNVESEFDNPVAEGERDDVEVMVERTESA